MLHVHVPHSEDRVLQYFGASVDSLPVAVIADMSSQSAIKKYMYVHLPQRKRGRFAFYLCKTVYFQGRNQS